VANFSAFFANPVKNRLRTSGGFEKIPGKSRNSSAIQLQEKFWESFAFYNFIQRCMDHRNGVNERPRPDEFQRSWPVFIELVRLLKPAFCIFAGVTAANFFNGSMHQLAINHTPVQRHARIDRACPRSASVLVEELSIEIAFLLHPCRMHRWAEWNAYLRNRSGAAMEWLSAQSKTVSGWHGPPNT
jgi:hypothetical protein